MIWPRVLSDQEINNIVTKCKCPQDYSVAMTMDRSELHGQAYYSFPDTQMSFIKLDNCLIWLFFLKVRRFNFATPN